MPDTGKQKLGMGGAAILAAMAALALFVALIVVPMISGSSGIADQNVSFMLGGIFLVVAAGCYVALKFMAPKENPEGPK